MEKYIYNINNLDAKMRKPIKVIWQGWTNERILKPSILHK